MKEKKVSSETAPTSLRLPPDLKKRFKAACAEAGVDMGSTIIGAIEAWLDQRGKAEAPTESPSPVQIVRRTGRHQKIHALLDEVLNHGNPQATWITGNLITFARPHNEQLASDVEADITGTPRKTGTER